MDASLGGGDTSSAATSNRWELAPFFAPKSVAVYGASERTSSDLIQNLLGPGVDVVGINPTRVNVCGVPCYPSLADSPIVPEVVVLAVGHQRVDGAVDEILATPSEVGGVVVPGLGNESGAEGQAMARRIASRLGAAGIPMIGPNCMGIATPSAPSPWIGRLPPTFVKGCVSAIVHSGSFGTDLVDLGPRMGFRTVASIGGENATDVADFMHYLADDESTRVVGLFLETVRRPNAFEAGLRRLAETGKPVIALKSGRSEAATRLALAHSGALVGSDRTLSAVLRHYGAIRVEDFADWIEHLVAFSSVRPVRGGRIGVVTASGGEAEHFADACEAIDLRLEPFSEGLQSRISSEFPNFTYVGNPLDCWAIDDERVVYPRVLDLMVGSDEFDVIVALVDQSRWSTGRTGASMSAIARDVISRCDGTGIYPCIVSMTTADAPDEDLRFFLDADVPMVKGIRSGVAAVAARARFRLVIPPPRPGRLADRFEGAGVVAEFDSALLVEGYGLPYVRVARCRTAAEAVLAAEAIGYPVAVKVDGGVAHKMAAGGVALGLTRSEEVNLAATRMGESVIVAEHVRGGVEVLVGGVRDPDFGPMIVVGLGGVFVEALDAVASGLAPMDEVGAERLVASVPPLKRLLGGDIPPSLVDAIVGLSRMLAEHPEIEEIDVNPLHVSEDRVVALDCLIILEKGAE
ncbi:MAG: acetate--CoA ligase family protein [Actinomycetota bacterium]